MMPHDLPPWYTVYQQTQRWSEAKVCESLAHDLHRLLRVAEGREVEPSAAIFDGRTLQSSVESGGRAGWDGHKRAQGTPGGSKGHLAVDTLGHRLALLVTPAHEQERAQMAELAPRWRTWPKRCSR